MDPLETRELVKKSPTDSSKKDDGQSSETCSRTSPLCIFMELFQWLQMLSSQLNPTFIFGVVVVYGLSQGLSGSFFKVFTDYYWKDVQKVQPSAVQLYMGLYYIPWVMKPIWGLFTDVFPVRGYKRRPYFIVAGVLGCVSAMLIALLGKVPIAVALSCLVGMTAGVAIADVTIDACIAKNSIEIRALAPDMQSLCGFCSSVGALIGYSSSGFFVHHLGPQLSLVLMAVPPVLLIVLGFVIYEVRSTSLQSEKKKAMEDLQMALRGMSKTIKLPQVWKPSLFMYLSLALSISTHEGHFYWYTDPKAGPAFSQEFVGIIYAVGALASIAGVLIYQKALKNYPFRSLLLYAQILYGVSGMLDLTFVLRWNLAIGIPDYFFVIAEECVTRIVSRIRWMPMIVLSTRLCPLGIEGTFFALLMCIDSLGSLSSKWGGGVFLHLFHVTRSDFTNLWLVILIRNVLRFATIGLIFLVPRGDQADNLIPPDILTANSAASLDDDGLELVPVKERSEEVHLLIDENHVQKF
ncbi:FOLATE-BIOPTERIN TRANSPORTER 6-RELATED [Salix viminalis]|uniref:FOLATE-BIOPTERIN TRANSPORTER 6-RELATED n=1 Tax=Salix viminalis TaxID=40686 RepID=A0A9Q0ZR59_SALVM|nr:FOLATE-BIOPTERIN TRANSPORTER 6-RELATED [Salix viminalis]